MQESTPKPYEPIDTFAWDPAATIEPEYFAAVDSREQELNGLTLFAGKVATKKITTIVAGAATVSVVGLAMLGGCNPLSVRGEANLDTAQAVSKTEIIEALKEHPIVVGTMYSLQDYAATNLEYKLTASVKLIKEFTQDLTYKTNTKVLGKTATQFLVPGDMVKNVASDPSSDKTIITLDPSKLQVNSYWLNAPSVNHFKLKDGKQEICENDCMEPQTILNTDFAEIFTHGSQDTLKNTFYIMDKKTNRKIQDVALSTTQTNCKEPMSAWVKEAAIEGVGGVSSGLTGKPAEKFEVRFDEGELKWNIKPVPESVEKVNDDVYKHKDVQITGAPELTKTECNTNGEE